MKLNQSFFCDYSCWKLLLLLLAWLSTDNFLLPLVEPVTNPRVPPPNSETIHYAVLFDYTVV